MLCLTNELLGGLSEQLISLKETIILKNCHVRFSNPTSQAYVYDKMLKETVNIKMTDIQ